MKKWYLSSNEVVEFNVATEDGCYYVGEDGIYIKKFITFDDRETAVNAAMRSITRRMHEIAREYTRLEKIYDSLKSEKTVV